MNLIQIQTPTSRKEDPDLATTPILELLAAYPQLRAPLDELGLDTCCGGHLTVSEAAAEHGLAPDAVLAALREHL